ncbi:Glycosyltransferase family 10 (fucosyltransferase) C-term [Thalassovita gelatinovora]|uniref:glycosyltransferase family 10 domain-containing protein n=1 Tax=Thalassovita gelatinovora TaxID=53501 RepID=UPI0008C88531|nr:glycosyltransferase family 10 [Thalassovita gelatinovora]QIZ82659.1 hypothetical protein HFZ77_18980 [Thalassovita gelatinovora]SER10939.1 Glycosyltransferase family 10 (fucosyltransferase) C-term [Thalassovita gelatinovora]
MIRFCAIGDYAHRQPLAYDQIRAHCRGAIELVDDPARADIVAVAHSKDIDTHAATLRALAPDQKPLLLSEEPFWDSCWGHDPLTRDLTHPTATGPLRLTQLNHATSRIYDFGAIPYFLLTDPHFATRYGLWFGHNAQISPAGWQRHFARVAGQGAFMMARRRSPRYDVSLADGAVFSLCNPRTDIAEACQAPGFAHIGQGWQDGPPRQTLADWHLDKYLALKARFRFIGAIENTHQSNYVTEKIFDAWAAGAVPLYIAAPGHRVHDLARPGSWVNLIDTRPEQVPERLAAVPMGPEFCDSYAAQQRALAALFGGREAWSRELDRLRAALVDEFETVLQSDG